MKVKIKFLYIDGRKQTPRDYDFCIIPTIKYSQADPQEVGDLGSAKGLAFEWGYWACGIGVYKAYIK